MICCGPLDDGYEMEKSKALSQRWKWESVGRPYQVCNFTRIEKKNFNKLTVVCVYV